MRNFRKWKIAKAVFHSTEDDYISAQKAMLSAGQRRSRAWAELVSVADKLTPAEKKMAAEFEFGPAVIATTCATQSEGQS